MGVGVAGVRKGFFVVGFWGLSWVWVVGSIFGLGGVMGRGKRVFSNFVGICLG